MTIWSCGETAKNYWNSWSLWILLRQLKRFRNVIVKSSWSSALKLALSGTVSPPLPHGKGTLITRPSIFLVTCCFVIEQSHSPTPPSRARCHQKQHETCVICSGREAQGRYSDLQGCSKWEKLLLLSTSPSATDQHEPKHKQYAWIQQGKDHQKQRA